MKIAKAIKISSFVGKFLGECHLLEDGTVVFVASADGTNFVKNLQNEVINGPDDEILTVEDGERYFDDLPHHLTKIGMKVEAL